MPQQKGNLVENTIPILGCVNVEYGIQAGSCLILSGILFYRAVFWGAAVENVRIIFEKIDDTSIYIPEFYPTTTLTIQ